MAKRKRAKRKIPKPATDPPQADGIHFYDGGIYRHLVKDGIDQGGEWLKSDLPPDFAKLLDKELEVWESHALASITPDPAAVRINRQSLSVLQWVNWMRAEIASGADTRLLYGAFLFGAATEKLYVLPHEDKTLKGKRAVNAPRAGRGIKAQKDADRRAKVRERCQELLAANPNMVKTKAVIILHRKFLRGQKQLPGYSKSAIRGLIADLF